MKHDLDYPRDLLPTDSAPGTYALLATKGREDTDVAHKDRAAHIWCENATLLTGAVWLYLIVPQREFEKLHPSDYADLRVLASPALF
ncbi:MAG: hypothetical protein ACR2M3_16595 [Thermomicrobiales bacterium]